MDSYEDILSRMIDKYTQLSGFKPSEQSDIMIRLKVLAGEVFNTSVAAEFIKTQMFPMSATGYYLDKHAAERGLTRKEAQKAKGEVKFILSTPIETDIVIPKGTVVSTATDDAKRFATDSAVTLTAGNMYVTAKVTAVAGGADYNVLENTVVVMVTPPQGVGAVTNSKAFTGGVDSETDEELRSRILDSYRDISNGTNAAYYKRLAQSVPGVYSASVISRARGAGTIDVCIKGKGDSSLSSTHVVKVQQLLDENRELNVDIMVKYAVAINAGFSIYMAVEDGYSFDDVSEAVTKKVKNYIDMLEIGEPALLCDLGDIIYHTTGVKNYSFRDAYCADVYPTQAQYCKYNGIDIRQVA